jgi:hypothetical protein
MVNFSGGRERCRRQCQWKRLTGQWTERAIDALLAHGYRITVHDHPYFVQRSTDRAAILANMEGMGAVEITMDIEGKRGSRAWMRLIYDENGYDLFQDYSCSIEHIVKPISEEFDPDNAPEAIRDCLTAAAECIRKPQDIQHLCYLLNVFAAESPQGALRGRVGRIRREPECIEILGTASKAWSRVVDP